jgi:hypothetical protein
MKWVFAYQEKNYDGTTGFCTVQKIKTIIYTYKNDGCWNRDL